MCVICVNGGMYVNFFLTRCRNSFKAISLKLGRMPVSKEDWSCILVFRPNRRNEGGAIGDRCHPNSKIFGKCKYAQFSIFVRYLSN